MAIGKNLKNNNSASTEETRSLLRRKLNLVASRTKLDSAVSKGAVWGTLFCALSAALVASGRLTGFLPEGTFDFQILFYPLGLGFAIGALSHRRTNHVEAAKLADDSLNAKDLFQTALSIKNPDSGYAKLPLADAEKEARRIDAAHAAPFTFQRRLWSLGVGLALLALCVAFVPRLDPFGRDAARKQAEENRKRSEDVKKQVERKLAALKKTDSKNSPEVKKLLAEIKQRFDALRKSRKVDNEKALKQVKSAIDDLWKRKASEKMRDKSLKAMSRRFMGALDAKERKWLAQMKKKNYSGLMKEAKEIQKLAAEIAKTSNPEERAKKKAQLKKRLQKLANFMKTQCGSRSCQNALKSAMEQLNMSGMNGVNQTAAMKSLANAMNLTQRELQKLQQMANDLKDLEMASKACQMARELNNLKRSMAANQNGMQSMEDYAKFYEQCVKQCKGKGKGKGKGKPGGGGGKAEENDKAQTAMKDEKSNSKLQPGKILMRWNVKGMGKIGTVDENYKGTVEKVKRDANEAILKEEVPPGYHDAIKRYFKDMK
jgi:hypothetical protein